MFRRLTLYIIIAQQQVTSNRGHMLQEKKARQLHVLGTADVKDFDPEEVFDFWLELSIAAGGKSACAVGKFFGESIPNLFAVNKRELSLMGKQERKDKGCKE